MSVGWAAWGDSVHIGLGDLLVNGLFFGPAAFAVAAALYRRHPERTTAQWLLEQATAVPVAQ